MPENITQEKTVQSNLESDISPDKAENQRRIISEALRWGIFKILAVIEKEFISHLIQYHKKQDLSFKLHFADSRVIKSNFKKWPGEGEAFYRRRGSSKF